MANTRKRQVWHQVKAPTRWAPKDNDELVGTYIGKNTRSGIYGDYTVHLVEVKNKVRKKIHYLSGVQLNDLFDMIPFDTIVKIVFKGRKPNKDGTREYKTFEVFTEEVIEFKLADVG